MPSTRSKTRPRSEPEHEWWLDAIGTRWWFAIYESASDLAALQQKVIRRIDEFDWAYSRFRTDSLITAMSKQAGTYQLPADSQELLTWYRELYDATEGKVTPLIGQLLADAGYDAGYSLSPGTLRKVPDWDDVMQLQGRKLALRQPSLLDFGAAGKGYLIDLLTDLFRREGVTRFCIDGSGDLFCTGLAEPLRIGLEQPDDHSQVIGVANIDGQALCASAADRRKWGNFHHIMDPQERAPVQGISAVWTVADTAMAADGLATALFFVPPQKLQQFRFEYVILYADGRAQYSPDWPGELF